MAMRNLLLLMMAILAFFGLFVNILYINFIAPVNATVQELFSNPNRYSGRDVLVEGSLRKVWFLNAFLYNLTDAGYGIAVSSLADEDLDAYVGLKVLVQGKFRHRSQLLDSPSFLIEVSTIHATNGKPRFFLQFERSGGIAGFQEAFILDNNATASFFNRGIIIWQKKLSNEEFQEVIRIILDSGFLSLEKDAYDPKEGVADFFSYRLKVIIASDDKIQSKAVAWVDEWASKEPLPLDLTRLVAELKAFMASFHSTG
ncbi:MAG: hypothetical protein QXO94_05840 [Candidatus Bathyarchaeia archaeon]